MSETCSGCRCPYYMCQCGFDAAALAEEYEQENVAADNDTIICSICGKPITGDDYDDRHWLHEDDCASRTDDEDGEELECDCRFIGECHADCCPDCNAPA